MTFKCPHCDGELEIVAGGRGGDSRPRSQPRRPSGPSNDIGDMLAQIEPAAMCGELDDDATAFFNKTKARYAQYGAHIQMSDKQMKFLRALATKAGVD